MDLSSKLFLKTSHKTLKFEEKCIFQKSADLNFKKFPFTVYHEATPWSHGIKQTVKKLNLWRKMSVDKSTWIKACYDKSQLPIARILYIGYVLLDQQK